MWRENGDDFGDIIVLAQEAMMKPRWKYNGMQNLFYRK